jgi:hypothetical protein
MTAPQRIEVMQVIDRLMSGGMSREAASAWASERHVQVAEDPVVEEVLDILTLIDARHVSEQGQPLDYMYDFAELSRARQALALDGDA